MTNNNIDEKAKNKIAKLTRSLMGEVVSNKMDKSIVVLVMRKKKHSTGKYITLSTRLHAHDENNECQKGDKVIIKESRPHSKNKRWALQKIIEKGVGESQG